MRVSKVFEFGKIDFLAIGKEINPVTAVVDWDGERFSASAYVWKQSRRDCHVGGQCFDELEPFFEDNKKFQQLYRLWQLYHLNDMNPGTPAQQAEVDWWLAKSGLKFDYNKVCLHLIEVGLFEVPASEADQFRKEYSNKLGQPHKYGYEWLLWPVPACDKAEIERLLSE